MNNLHPKKYQKLYSLIERVTDAATPPWNMSLAPKVKWNWRTRIYYNGSYTNPTVKPDVGDFVPRPEHPPLDLRQTYKDHGLQVIVKLANIELTPQKPTYSGGLWHVEGQLVSIIDCYAENQPLIPFRTSTFARQRYTTIVTKTSKIANSRSDSSQTSIRPWKWITSKTSTISYPSATVSEPKIQVYNS